MSYYSCQLWLPCIWLIWWTNCKNVKKKGHSLAQFYTVDYKDIFGVCLATPLFKTAILPTIWLILLPWQLYRVNFMGSEWTGICSPISTILVTESQTWHVYVGLHLLSSHNAIIPNILLIWLSWQAKLLHLDCTKLKYYIN